MVKICDVTNKSLAQNVGIQKGDILLAINANEINDVLDYRFYTTDTTLQMTLQRENENYSVVIEKNEYDDIGLAFDTPLMDKKHSCANKCIFCFIDQLPKGMRSSLYFKDDDDRLSFLHGNYITLTNLVKKDIDRIIKMHISPVNISVHTTNPELRVKMMGNRRAGEVLSYMKDLSKAGISICAQIVLCKGWNDKKELDKTMKDLTKLHSLCSCSIVPVGLTKCREGLCELEAFSKEDALAVIEQVNNFGNLCKKKYGSRLFYCSDEFYLKAGLPLPTDEYYEDYAQIENGVGLLASQKEEFEFCLKDSVFPILKEKREISLITGMAAKDQIIELCNLLCKKEPLLTVYVYPIVNHFFGESVTVAGLLTGKDALEQLQGKELGKELLFPASMLKADEDVYLDDTTPKQLEKELNVPLKSVNSDGQSLFDALLGE